MLGVKKEKGSLVVADSDPEALESASKILRDHGYVVFQAGNGQEALELVRKQRPSLAVLDLRLAKVSGFQVIRLLTDQFNPVNKDVWQTPFVMTCNKVTGRDRQYAISLGVKYYFAKPLNPATLCSSVEKLLGSYPSLR